MSSTGPGPDDPPRQRPIPGWCWVADEWRGLRIGQTVRVPGVMREACIFEISSHRLGGGVSCTLVFPDWSWVRRRGADVVEHNPELVDESE